MPVIFRYSKMELEGKYIYRNGENNLFVFSQNLNFLQDYGRYWKDDDSIG